MFTQAKPGTMPRGDYLKKLLFVCSGNTCRSPLAEGLFKKYLADSGIDSVAVSSAGLSALSGDEVSINSVLAAHKRGVDISLHRARPVNPQDILESDLIVCMSPSHARAVDSLLPYKTLVLNVPDPYGQSEAVYEQCCKAIEGQFPEVLEALLNAPEIRPMQAEDIKALAELEKECFESPWSENSLSAELEKTEARFFVLRQDGEICGYIGADNILGQVFITNIAVKAQHRRRGFGERLLRQLILQSRFENAQLVTLEVRVSNSSAIALYEKCGFKNVGERRDFYSNPRENAYIYTFYFD